MLPDENYPTPKESSGLNHYEIGCPWCAWRDESDKGTLGITECYHDHMDNAHTARLEAFRNPT